MSSPAIDKYYTSVQKIKDWGGSHKETAIRQAFITLLNHYAEKKDLFLITELAVEGKHGKKVMLEPASCGTQVRGSAGAVQEVISDM